MSDKITVLKPPSKKLRIDFSELWEYRELTIMMMVRDIKVRYKQTVLGVSWAIIQPLTSMIIFSIIFGRLAKIPSDGVPYPIFVFSGLLAWNFFSTAVSAGGVSMVNAASMVSKVYFPRIVIPIAAIGVSVVDFLVSLVILLVLMLIYQITPTTQLLLFPVFAIGLVMSAIGISMWLTAITVVYRDFRFVIPFMVQIWMYVTPIIYPVSFVPESWRWVLYMNPVLGWVEGIRASILGQAINWQAVGSSSILTALLLYLGMRYFHRAERRFADVI